MSATSASAVLVCALTLSVGAFAEAAAQATSGAKLHVDLSPFVGSGRPASTIRVPDGGSAAWLDTHAVFGIATEVSWEELPLSLRVSGSGTRGVSVQRVDGRYCGSPNCFSSSHAEIGSASVTSFWADAVVVPFSWDVAPYGFLGLGKRWIHYHDTTPGVVRPEGSLVQRYGLGIDMKFNFARASSFWIETAAQGGATWLGVEGYEVPTYLQVTAGLKLPVF